MLKERFFCSGLGFVQRGDISYSLHRKAASVMLKWTESVLAEADLLVLDESIYALNYALISVDELQNLLLSARCTSTHLVLSGREAPEWLLEEADLVSTILPTKHPKQHHIGIEF